MIRLLLSLSLALTLSCDSGGDGGDGGGEAEGDLDYYCQREAAAWCPAYSDCDPARFDQAFDSIEQCTAQREQDCLDPPEGFEPCAGATVEETDECVAFLEANHPDGCSNLFGPTADPSLCEEDICD